METHSHSHSLLALALALALAGCGPSADAYPFVRGDASTVDAFRAHDTGVHADMGPPTVPNDPLENWGDAGMLGPLTGIFALEVRVNATVVVPIMTRQLYRVRIQQSGAHVRARIQACVIDLASIQGIATLAFTPGAVGAIRMHVVDIEGDYLSSTNPIGATFTPPRTTVVIGAMLTNPETDALPTMMMPTSAIDEDMDGHPGVTIDAINVIVCHNIPQQVYAAFRASINLNGMVTDINTIEGSVDPSVDQSILGISDGCLTVAENLQIMVQPGSAFTARRVDMTEDLNGDGNVSCPEIGWYAPRLFPDGYWLR
jgi:hypothetical protein